MRKTITVIATVALAVAAVALVQPAGAGSSIAGKKCDKAGLRKTSQGKEYVCKKQGGKLVWVVVRQPGPGPQPSPSPSPTEPAYPSITTFLTNPSDRLPADMSTVHGTAPFLGARAAAPHKGIHIYWSNRDGRWTSATAPSDFPAIYAIADGMVGPIETLKRMGSHDAYSLLLTIAKSPTGDQVTASYSLEPFVPEPSPGFYAPFILVKQGQQVHKGDILAYMYVPPTSTGSTHLHLHLGTNDQLQSPSIFTPEAVTAFAEKFGDAGGYENGAKLPACIGYKVTAEENPYGTGASDCL